MIGIEPQDQRHKCILFYHQTITRCLLIFYILLYILDTFKCYIRKKKKLEAPKIARPGTVAHLALLKVGPAASSCLGPTLANTNNLHISMACFFIHIFIIIMYNIIYSSGISHIQSIKWKQSTSTYHNHIRKTSSLVISYSHIAHTKGWVAL